MELVSPSSGRRSMWRMIGAFGGEIRNKSANALPPRPQVDYNLNTCIFDVNRFGSLIFPTLLKCLAVAMRGVICRYTIGRALRQGFSIISINSGQWRYAASSTEDGCRGACRPLLNSEAGREKRMP